MNKKLTKEQNRISRRNRIRASKYFDLPDGWVLHHKDVTLRHNDIERYIEWRPEDLVPMSRVEHNKLHFTGNGNPNYGKNTPKEVREKISNTLYGRYRGEDSPHYGKKLSEETKSKISESRKGKCSGEDHYMYGKHLDDDTKSKISNTLKGRYCGSLNSTSKPVRCIETGEEFESARMVLNVYNNALPSKI